MFQERNALRAVCNTIFTVKERKGWTVPLRQNRHAALWYVHKGGLNLTIFGESRKFQSGSVLLLPPDTPFHAELAEDAAFVRITVVRFDLLVRQDLNWLRLFKAPALLTDRACRKQKRLLLDIWAVKHARSPFSEMRRNGSLEMLLSMLLEKVWPATIPYEQTRNKYEYQVFQIVSWMEEHLESKASLSELASIISVSAEHLIAMFQEVLNDSPIRYWTRLRIRKAKELLQWTNLPVKDISERVGYGDPLYFSRTFRKLEDMPPTQYRNNLLTL